MAGGSPSRRPGASATPPAAPPETPTPCPSAREVARAREALAHLGAAYVDDYDAWLRVGLALRQLGEAGRELWHRWSSGSPKYEADVVDAKWDGFAAGVGAGRVTLGTLFHMAKLEGWAGSCASGTSRQHGRFRIATVGAVPAREERG